LIFPKEGVKLRHSYMSQMIQITWTANLSSTSSTSTSFNPEIISCWRQEVLHTLILCINVHFPILVLFLWCHSKVDYMNLKIVSHTHSWWGKSFLGDQSTYVLSTCFLDCPEATN
jgi:hypothetical protein